MGTLITESEQITNKVLREDLVSWTIREITSSIMTLHSTMVIYHLYELRPSFDQVEAASKKLWGEIDRRDRSAQVADSLTKVVAANVDTNPHP